MTNQEFQELALSFRGTEQGPHFDRIAFKVVNKRIFATLHIASDTANLKLSEAEQKVFCAYKDNAIYRVPNKWGLHGWTTFELPKVPKELVLAALESAYTEAVKSGKKKSR